MEKILIIEDEPEVRQNICEILECKDYKVFSAKDGIEGVQIAKDILPDLVISDIMMPGMNGFQVLEEFQKDELLSSMPFIFLSAKTDKISIRSGMELGADDYLTKPFRAKELISAVQIRLRKKERLQKEVDNLRKNISMTLPHEMRTPLIPILGYSQIILDDYDNLTKEEIIEMVTQIKIGSKRLSARIEKFINYSAVEIYFGDPELLKTMADSIIEYTRELISQTAIEIVRQFDREKDIKVVVEQAELKIPESYLRIIIKEIIENACKFSDEFSPILLEGKLHDGHYEITINNSGRGMSRDEINKIRAFEQFKKDVYQQVGTGLGLITAKRAAELFGGEFFIESVENKSTSIRIKLPLNNRN